MKKASIMSEFVDNLWRWYQNASWNEVIDPILKKEFEDVGDLRSLDPEVDKAVHLSGKKWHLFYLVTKEILTKNWT